MNVKITFDFMTSVPEFVNDSYVEYIGIRCIGEV